MVETPHEGYIEGSLRALNRNFYKVGFNGAPPLKGE